MNTPRTPVHGLQLTGVTKDYPTAGKRRTPTMKRVLDGIDLHVTPGEFLCIVGASGSGKSTLLSLIAGLEPTTSGTITWDNTPVTGPGPDRGLVFQTGELFPWRTVAANVAFGLEPLRISKAERAQRVAWYLEEVGLTEHAHALPGKLSGGQRQRVAIARALACEPHVLLLDEPFGALDVQTKQDMQVFLRQVWTDTHTTIVMVTHDVEEAVFLAQRVIVLASDPGHITAELTIGLPPDRTPTHRRTPQFLTQRSEIEDLLRSGRTGTAKIG